MLVPLDLTVADTTSSDSGLHRKHLEQWYRSLLHAMLRSVLRFLSKSIESGHHLGSTAVLFDVRRFSNQVGERNLTSPAPPEKKPGAQLTGGAPPAHFLSVDSTISAPLGSPEPILVIDS